jgi:hypothetical protein
MIPIGAIIGTFVLTYLVVGRGMIEIFIPLALIIIFLIGFFSVKVSLILLVFSMLLSPEIGMGATSSRAVTGRIDDIILLTLTVGWMLRMAIIKDIGFMLKTKLNGPILIYCTIIVLSTALGVVRGNVKPLTGTLYVVKLIEYFFIFNVVVNYIQTQKEIENLLTMILVVCGIVCVYALIHRAAGGSVQAPFEGSEGERNTLSGYLVIVGSVAAGVLFYTQHKFERFALAGLILLIIGVLLASLSRSGWMAFAVSIIVLFRVVKTKNVYVQIIVLALFIIPLFFISPEVTDRFKYTFTAAGGSEAQVTLFGIKFDPSSSARLLCYSWALQFFIRHAVLGHGITGYGFIDGQYFTILTELGLVGLGAFFWLLFSIQKIIRTAMHTEGLPPRLQGMVKGFYAGFWGILAHAATANSFVIVRIAEPFWFITGMIVVMLILREQRTEVDTVVFPQVAT